MTTPTTPPNPLASPSGPPASTPPEVPATGKKAMAISLCVVGAAFAALVAFTVSRHLGAEALASLGWAGGTFVGAYHVVQNILEKCGQL
ncbi:MULTISPECIES: hypothetical protein [unclassified Streptomyces]|uniref:hypothetical protein n=1 Tax=unclassified Streptomyces TaxID=2593676 RepID=UPI002E32C6E8|nr:MULTISPECIES: hypothetical protein [unclassified Streptomyces]